MNTTPAAATTAPLRRRSNTVPERTRDWGVSHQRPLEALQKAIWTRRERAILRHLLTAIRENGSADPVSRAELKTSAAMMQNLYNNGLVNGAGSRDARGSGNTPQSSLWWLTSSGEALARHLAQGGR